ncbi:MAG TPA: hypothetical protein VF460_01885 [Burkholderiales bacterium]
MNQLFKSSLLGLALACTIGTGMAWAEGTAPSNGRERFFLKRQNCPWTEEMGKAIYECLKANDGFNAHWCHNETLDQFCPVDENAVPHPAAETEKKG